MAEGLRDALVSIDWSPGHNIVWHYLRDPMFSRFDTIPACDTHIPTQTDRHTTTAHTALSIASRAQNSCHSLSSTAR